MDANGRSWGNALADGRCPNSRANGAEWDNSGQRPGFMRWNRRMFHTKARSHEGGQAGCAGAAFVALGKRVWCLATFVDLVSYRASHDSPRNPKGVQPQSPGLRRRGATPGPCPTYKQPQRGCAEATSGEAPAVWLDPAEWATPSLVFNISTHPVGGASTRSLLRHNRVAVVAVFRYAPGAARRTAQPRALGQNTDIPDGATPGLVQRGWGGGRGESRMDADGRERGNAHADGR